MHSHIYRMHALLQKHNFNGLDNMLDVLEQNPFSMQGFSEI